MGGGSSPPQQTTTTVQNNEPAEWARPALQELGTDTLGSYRAGEFDVEPYQGNTVVPYATETTQAMDMLRNLGQGGAGNIETANHQVGNILDQGGINTQQQGQIDNMARVAGGGYRPEQMVGVQGMMDTASGANLDGNPYLDRIFDRGATAIGRSVNDAMGSAGRYGSGAHQATLADSIGDFHSDVYADNYARERQNQIGAQQGLIGAGQAQDSLATGAAGSAFNALDAGNRNIFQAAGMSPNLYTAQALPSEFLRDVGGMQEDLSARELDQDIARHDANELRPYNELQRLNALASGAVQTGGSGTSTVRGPGQAQPSTASRFLGGASAGAGFGSMFGPWGTGIGAIGGGLLGGFF